MPQALIVDDEPDVLSSAQAFLEAEGVRTHVFANAPDALAFLDHAKVDVILSDYRMAPMNGLDFLVQAAKRHPATPRILFTAYADMDLAIAALNDARIHYFLRKPFDPRKLLGAIREILDLGSDAVRQMALRRAIEARDGDLP